MDVNQLQQILADQKQAPVEKWHPENCGEMDLVIKNDASWWYMGSKINRKRLVKLFSTVLKKEEDDYFLVTPVEKIKIQVEDVPFKIINLQQIKDKKYAHPLIVMQNNIGELIPLNNEHPLEIKQDNNGFPLPYITVRKNLNAKLSRSVFYEIVTLAKPTQLNGVEHLIVHSGDWNFDLGAAE